jgi:hypothetical protein
MADTSWQGQLAAAALAGCISSNPARSLNGYGFPSALANPPNIEASGLGRFGLGNSAGIKQPGGPPHRGSNSKPI